MSETIISSFQRYEVKYFLSPAQKEALMPTLLEHFSVDSYGQHSIGNIFYDTDNFEVIRASIEKPIYKEKLRLRAYGVPERDTGQVFLELKKKYQHVVYKRRIAAPIGETVSFLAGGAPPAQADPQICQEIQNFLSLHHPVPKVYIGYDRVAMFGKDDPELRITFDQNLIWRDTDLDLCSGAYGELLLPEDTTLMEIKVPGTMPLWLAHLLSQNNVFRTSFSKVGACYTKFILPKIYSEKDVLLHV
jgi:hypothetical protein